MYRDLSIEDRITSWPWWRRLIWQLFPYIPKDPSVSDHEPI